MPTSSKIKKNGIAQCNRNAEKTKRIGDKPFFLTCVNAKKWEKSEIRIKCIENTCQFCVRRGW